MPFKESKQGLSQSKNNVYRSAIREGKWRNRVEKTVNEIIPVNKKTLAHGSHNYTLKSNTSITFPLVTNESSGDNTIGACFGLSE